MYKIPLLVFGVGLGIMIVMTIADIALPKEELTKQPLFLIATNITGVALGMVYTAFKSEQDPRIPRPSQTVSRADDWISWESENEYWN